MRYAQSLFLASSLALAATPALADVPKVVASVKPIHSLVAAVMQGLGEPHLIIEGAGSPHTYALKPSDASALQEADVVFWVGHSLETFLEDPIESLSNQAQVVELAEADGVTVLAAREDDHAEEHHEEESHHERAHDEHGAHEGHHHGSEDGHIWLDTRNALALTDAITGALSAADQENAPRYAANAEAVKAKIAALEDEMKRELAPVKDRPFIVFHDAYQYFERQFGLQRAGVIALNPEVAPGARQVRELQKKIADLGAVCIFAEPQFNADIVSIVAEGTSAQTGTLDPLGAGIEAGREAYFQIMRTLSGEAANCLSKAG